MSVLRPRISLFSCLIVLTAVAIWMGVVASRAHRQKAAVDLLKRMGGSVYYDYQCRKAGEAISIKSPSPSTGFRVVNKGPILLRVSNERESYLLDHFAPAASPVPDWISDIVGDDLFVSVIAAHVIDKKLTDEQARVLAGLPNLRVLKLRGASITDDSLSYLARMRNLEQLDLSNTQIRGHGLRHLAALTKLEKLDLSHTHVGDKGLQGLSAPPSLTWLSLKATPIGDRGLHYLSNAKRLQWLNLESTQLRGFGLKQLADCPLAELRLGYTNVKFDGLASLGQAAELQTLTLEHSQLDDQGMQVLETFKQLKTLHLPWVAHRTTNISAVAARRLEKKLSATKIDYPP